jgi:hypothetical protein
MRAQSSATNRSRNSKSYLGMPQDRCVPLGILVTIGLYRVETK